MDLAALLADYRDRADDLAKPYRADDTRVTRWLNEAVDEACARADLIFDVTSACCEIALTAGEASYPLAREIHKISAAWTDKYKTTLDATDQSALDRGGKPCVIPRYRGRRGGDYLARSDYWAQWRTQTGNPTFYIRDDQRIRLVPIPNADDTLHLEVYRAPFPNERLDCTRPDGCPRIAQAYHSGLVDWALYRAYLRRDEDQNDPQLAATHLALFEARFGARPDANVVRKRSEQRSHVTAVNWP